VPRAIVRVTDPDTGKANDLTFIGVSRDDVLAALRQIRPATQQQKTKAG
jgi:hypothetical protein